MHKAIDVIFGSGRVMEGVRIVINNNFIVLKSMIQKNLMDKGSILDIGCGTGYFSRLFKNAKYVGIDNSEKYISFANKKYGGKFFVMDATKMNFNKSVFDSILMLSFLHHLPNNELKRVFSDTKRVLKKGGRLLIIDPVPVREQSNFIRKFIFKNDRGHYGRSKIEVIKLLKPYFKLDKYEVRDSLTCTLQLFACSKKNG